MTRETKLIAVTNPNNPTGALREGGLLDECLYIARQAGAWILSDEVYRGNEQEGSCRTASIADL